MLRLAPRCISNHRRHLATVASNHATEFKMPLIDFSRFLRGDDKDQAAVARELLEGFTTSGFVYLGGDHGISSTLRQKTFAESAKFFAMPRDVKESLAWLTAQENRGYLVPGRERVSRLQTKAEVDAAKTKAPDVKETYEIGKEESEVYTNKWPSQAANPSFKPAMLDFYTQCHNLQLQVMSCLALSLGLDKNFFEQHCNGRDHNLRLLHYPAVPALQSGEKKAETNRAGAHTDYGTVTLLFQDDVGGLEVLTPSGTYVAATPIPGTIVINAGDLLSRWSNNLIVSTEHRVVSPPGNKDGSLPERYSIAFFSNPNQDAVIEALPGTYKTEQDRIHKSIRTHEYLTQRLSATVGDGPASATRSQVRKYSTTARDYSTTAQSPSSVSADEISHFDTLAATWWDPNGTSGLLHKMNPARIGFIRSHMVPKPIFSSDLESVDPLWLSGKKTLDVGCGGGLLSEALSRVGADITGVDASSAGITVAKEHARQMGVQVEYLHTSAEELAASRTESYDVVCAMEILEHVSSPASFLKTVMTLLKPGGMLFISTIEKTQFAKFLTCTIAEDILRLVPKGTHNYDKFIPKEAIKSWMSELGGEVIDTRGIIFDPLAGTWRVLNKGQTWGEACNYIMAIKKAA